MELLFIGLAIGSIIAYVIFLRFNNLRRKGKTSSQSVILMEKIRSVCKFITVEGDFSEIYHYENVQQKWLNLLLGKKKALVLIEARAYVGYDLTQIKMQANEETKTIIINEFPKPQLLSIETDFKYYDKKEGWANPFTAEDLTEINNEAKQHIVDKIPSSGLFDEASKQALDTINLISQLASTINWKVDHTALHIPESAKKISASKNELL
ncbi:hypothetical protein ULMS_00220 [Patiriisocius marinistellae]|uniref:DUF4230 domain-containing protein n=1 Tax=Patiriisocius marinistellae TaxID=2494560 RepID=A0A5J4FU45_9FLAO|nr:DUF4230 domain-containing protein [Patiriisocius marinistellae]GEQ84514.1 hypothetical protein ULMS_00220 [Patiriisocius marinistellae]